MGGIKPPSKARFHGSPHYTVGALLGSGHTPHFVYLLSFFKGDMLREFERVIRFGVCVRVPINAKDPAFQE